MIKWIKIFSSCFVLFILIYEANFYINCKANSYLAVYGGPLNHYKEDFVLLLNDQKISETLNVNIPTPFSQGVNFSLGKNTIKLISTDAKISFEKEIYFYGIFSFNIIEVTSKDIFFRRSFSVPVI
ncbi:hypothetical protein HNP37_004715 [Flavobacterium nitrogenifigens]|uniref:Uncharacterized protein n=2 Tax=Flavobacterium TaxID=237 RepID=A0A7W7N982_9FLAO|nr:MULTISPECIES: hypothetical protein [Flavobacterium]MBB4804618.1 hypothetical protein [Flavobacterium nitrogenifigens]MBB6389577.1 hypothetical protein [Flavobacterium notoginsengisoli]